MKADLQETLGRSKVGPAPLAAIVHYPSKPRSWSFRVLSESSAICRVVGLVIILAQWVARCNVILSSEYIWLHKREVCQCRRLVAASLVLFRSYLLHILAVQNFCQPLSKTTSEIRESAEAMIKFDKINEIYRWNGTVFLMKVAFQSQAASDRCATSKNYEPGYVAHHPACHRPPNLRPSPCSLSF
jgi:hypothetical protein